MRRFSSVGLGMPIAIDSSDTRRLGRKPDVSVGCCQESGWFQASLSYVPEQLLFWDALARVFENLTSTQCHGLET
jgi:hypothetical protein